MSSLVRSLKGEMQNSGIWVDCSKLKTQLIRLKENHVNSYGPSFNDVGGNGQVLIVDFNYKPVAVGNQSQIMQAPEGDTEHLQQSTNNQNSDKTEN